MLCLQDFRVQSPLSFKTFSFYGPRFKIQTEEVCAEYGETQGLHFLFTQEYGA